MVRAAKPLAARVYSSLSNKYMRVLAVGTYYDTVVPGKDGKLGQAGDKVPASSDVSSKEDAKGEDGYRVHLAASLKSRDARSVMYCLCPGQGHWYDMVVRGEMAGRLGAVLGHVSDDDCGIEGTNTRARPTDFQ